MWQSVFCVNIKARSFLISLFEPGGGVLQGPTTKTTNTQFSVSKKREVLHLQHESLPYSWHRCSALRAIFPKKWECQQPNLWSEHGCAIWICKVSKAHKETDILCWDCGWKVERVPRRIRWRNYLSVSLLCTEKFWKHNSGKRKWCLCWIK